MRLLTTAFFAVALAGCLSTPSDPTWVDDVRPILAANCVRCHNAPSTGGAPDSFRLDVYEDVVADDGRVIRGAGSMAEFIYVRTDAEQMPPRFPLSQRQRDILENWRLDGVDLGTRPPRGDRASGAPTFTLRRPLADSLGADGTLEILYEIRDPDRDLVRGELRFGADSASAEVISTSLISGRGHVVWDVGVLPNGDSKLFAVLDDGAGQDVTIEVASYSVSHGANTAPAVTLAAPALYDILSDADSPVGVRFTVADPDAGDTLTATIEATRGSETITVANATPVTVGENTIPWDTTGVTAANGWTLTVTVTDGTLSRSTAARDLVISHGTTTLTFADVETIFAFRCLGCHPGTNRVPDLTHDFSSYADVDQAKGIYATRGLIYRRVAIQRNMPPKSAAIFGDDPLSSDEASKLSEWLLAGAPQ